MLGVFAMVALSQLFCVACCWLLCCVSFEERASERVVIVGSSSTLLGKLCQWNGKLRLSKFSYDIRWGYGT